MSTPARSLILAEHVRLTDLEALKELYAQMAHKLKCNQALIAAVNDETKRAKLVHKASQRQRQMNALASAIHMEATLTQQC